MVKPVLIRVSTKTSVPHEYLGLHTGVILVATVPRGDVSLILLP